MHPLPGTPVAWSCAAHENRDCPECRALLGEVVGLLADLDACEASAAVAAPPAPVVPPLGRVALGSPSDAAAVAVIRGLLADERIRRSIEHAAREWSAAVEGHEYRAAQAPEGLGRTTQEELAREARQHRDLYRAVLALHVPSVPHAESVADAALTEEAPRHALTAVSEERLAGRRVKGAAGGDGR